MEEWRLFDKRLPDFSKDLENNLRELNPWWSGRPGRVLPSFRRWPFARLLRHVQAPVAPILALRGPRQIGKTTLQEQVIGELLVEGVSPARILRVQFDDLPSLEAHRRKEPILRIVEWFEKFILGRTLNEAAHAGEPAILFFDEVQNLKTWDVQLKALVDRSTVTVFVTGSSALRLEAGRDSLAGRVQTLEVGPLRLYEIAAIRGEGRFTPFQAENGLEEWLKAEFWNDLNTYCLDRKQEISQAFLAFGDRGSYPLAQRNPAQAWPEVAEQLVETVVRRVIQHDLRMGERGRKRDEILLESVFRLACRYAGQCPLPGKMADELKVTHEANLGVQRVQSYLRFLDGSLLVHLVEPLEIRLKRQRTSPKICLSDHAIRSAWLHEKVSLDPAELQQDEVMATLAGRIVESVVGYSLASMPGLQTAHLPARKGTGEIDFVVSIGDKRIPIEVKYRRNISPSRDFGAIEEFVSLPSNNASFGLVITQEPVDTGSPRVVAVPLPHLLSVR